MRAYLRKLMKIFQIAACSHNNANYVFLLNLCRKKIENFQIEFHKIQTLNFLLNLHIYQTPNNVQSTILAMAQCHVTTQSITARAILE